MFPRLGSRYWRGLTTVVVFVEVVVVLEVIERRGLWATQADEQNAHQCGDEAAADELHEFFTIHRRVELGGHNAVAGDSQTCEDKHDSEKHQFGHSTFPRRLHTFDSGNNTIHAIHIKVKIFANCRKLGCIIYKLLYIESRTFEKQKCIKEKLNE